VCVCVCVCVCVFLYKHLLYCMLHYYGLIIRALMFTFTYYLLLSTYSIYSMASYLPVLDYTLYFVQYCVVREFFEEFVEFYTKCAFIHWPVF